MQIKSATQLSAATSVKLNLITLYLVLSGTICLLAVGLLTGMVILRYPGNHGSSAAGMLLILIPTCGVLLAPWLMRSRLRYWLLASWLAAFLSPIVLDRFNICVAYETWIDRGMPLWGTPVWQNSKR